MDPFSASSVTGLGTGSFALAKRGIIGTYHHVVREYLHPYLWQFDFVWNGRQLKGGEGAVAAV
jgi:hypothetical protein